MALLFHNCRVLKNYELVRGEVWVRDGRVVEASSLDQKLAGEVTRIDCHNNILCPGFIDLQVNGAFGCDFSNTEDCQAALNTISTNLPRHGVTSYVPTLITSSPADYRKRVPHLDYQETKGKATVLGVHLEGPFLSEVKRGCHPPELLMRFDASRQASFTDASFTDASFTDERPEDRPIKDTDVKDSTESSEQTKTSEKQTKTSKKQTLTSEQQILSSEKETKEFSGTSVKSGFESVAGNDELQRMDAIVRKGLERASEEDLRSWNSVLAAYGAAQLRNCLIITIAPELKGAMFAYEILSKLDIIVSMGHSEATYLQGRDGIKHGARNLTHLFSAMNAFGHREPSLPGLICDDFIDKGPPKKLKDIILRSRGEPIPVVEKRRAEEGSRLFYGLIADCIHTHPTTLLVAYRLNKEGLCLVTDSISALGLPDGEYHIGATAVTVSGSPRRAFKMGCPDVLAGVVAPMNECVRNFVRETRCPPGYALAAASLHPARCLGIQDIKGSLRPGADADLVLLDDDFNVLRTFVNGVEAFDGLSQNQPDQFF